MKSEYETLSLASLREVAKNKGFKGISTLRKSELLALLIESDSMESGIEKKDNIASDYVQKQENLNEQNSTSNIINQDLKTSTLEKERAENRLDIDTEKYNSDKMEHKGNTIKGNTIKESSQRESYSKEASKENVCKEYGAKDKVDVIQAQEKRDYRVENRPVDNQSEHRTAERTSGHKSEVKNDSRYIENKLDSKSPVRQDTRNENRHEMKVDPSTAQKKSNYIPTEMDQLDSGETKEGILEVLPDGYGFIRCDNFLPGENDVYVSPAQIRRFNLKTGDIVCGNTRIKNQNEKFSALLYVKSVNGFLPVEAQRRKRFEDLTPVFPNERIHLETPDSSVAMRMVDLVSPIGKGQRGMIVSQPKTGKTTLLKQVATAITKNYPDMNLIILLIDERPEEVTDIKECIQGKNVEVIYSTFDELPENHKRVSEMVIERAKRLVEHKKDVVILLDSITRLARAYNLTVQASGRTLSGGLDPAALHMPKKFFGAARNMREGGSLTILATALVDTGSRMDDVVFEEFKGTGNMELVLDRSLSEKRIFPAIDLPKSSTRRDDLLLNKSEQEANYMMRKALSSLRSDEALERIIDMFMKTKSNEELVELVKKTKILV